MAQHARPLPDTTPRLVTFEQAGHELGISPFTIRTWVQRGHLQAVKVGKLLRLRRADVDRLATEGLTLAQTDQ